MSSKPVVFDDDNPEWTDADFARARPGAEVLPPNVVAAVRRGGRPKGSTTSQKQVVTLRLDRDVVARFKEGGPGWQTRVNEALRKAAKV